MRRCESYLFTGVSTLEHLFSLGWNAHLQTEYCREASNTTPARIVAVDRSSVLVATSMADIGCPIRVSLSGKLRHEGVCDLAVGDWVGVHETRVDHLYSRRSVFVRKRAGSSSRQQAIAANVDQTLVTMSLNDDFSPARAERYILAAWNAGTTPLILLSKADLVSDAGAALDALGDVAAGCEIVVVSAVNGRGIETLKGHLGEGKTAVLVGSSGVGKSSLLNALLGEQSQAIAPSRESDDKGRHTTTRRELLLLPETGSLLIDTPGMREFGVIGTGQQRDESGFRMSFSDVEALAEMCSFYDCAHLSEPGCEILRAIAEDELDPRRLRSYQKLQRELAYNERRGDLGKQHQERRLWKKRSQEYRRRTKHSQKS